MEEEKRGSAFELAVCVLSMTAPPIGVSRGYQGERESRRARGGFAGIQKKSYILYVIYHIFKDLSILEFKSAYQQGLMLSPRMTLDTNSE